MCTSHPSLPPSASCFHPFHGTYVFQSLRCAPRSHTPNRDLVCYPSPSRPTVQTPCHHHHLPLLPQLLATLALDLPRPPWQTRLPCRPRVYQRSRRSSEQVVECAHLRQVWTVLSFRACERARNVLVLHDGEYTLISAQPLSDPKCRPQLLVMTIIHPAQRSGFLCPFPGARSLLQLHHHRCDA